MTLLLCCPCLQERIAELESEAMGERPWQLTGEVSAASRPLNRCGTAVCWLTVWHAALPLHVLGASRRFRLVLSACMPLMAHEPLAELRPRPQPHAH